MRVTIVGREFPPAVSGIGDHSDHLASALAARGETVSVVCEGPAEERSAFDVVPIEWGSPARIARAVADTKPDVILWQYNPFSVGPRGLARDAGTLARALAACAPLVVTFHELWFPWRAGGLRGAVWAVVQRLRALTVLRYARRWIVTTEARERTLGRYGGDKVRRIPVGTNVEPTGGDARARLGIPADAFVVGHLGGVGPGKDLGPAYDAVVTLRARGIDARLLLAGKTGPFERPAGLNGEIVLTGTLARIDLSPVLAAADVYLHADPVGPSAGRRTSLVAALAHGLPVVAYRGPDHAGELVDGENVIVAERDGAALARALEALAADPKRRRAIGASARATFEQTFSWPRIADAYAAAYTDLP